jgi:acyl-CoA thioesterase FadM
MSRVKIELPEQFSFSTVIPVRITDLNYGGHLGNDKVLTFLHEARIQFLHHHGLSELDFAGTGLIMTDAAIEFKNEVFYGDEIKAFVAVDNISRVGFDIVYKLVKTNGELNVAFGKTSMVCYDYSKKKIAPLPQEARGKFGAV